MVGDVCGWSVSGRRENSLDDRILDRLRSKVADRAAPSVENPEGCSSVGVHFLDLDLIDHAAAAGGLCLA